MSETTQTPSEFIESLSGFEELAIEKHVSGFDIYADGATRSVRAVRCLIFVDRVRKGDSNADAKRYAFELPFSAVGDYFAAEETDAFADDPDTESGKDAYADA